MSQYNAILANTLGLFEKQAHCQVDDASDTAIQFKIIAAELDRLFTLLEEAQKQIFPTTATGKFLEQHGAVRGIYKKSAAKASGQITFQCQTPPAEDLLIPAGTLCASSRAEGLLYQTTQDGIIKAGKTLVTVIGEALETGSQANLAPGYLDLLVAPIPGITSINNPSKMAGGCEEEEDEPFRVRVIEAFRKISNGANLAYYEQFAKNLPGVWLAKAVYTPGVSNQIDLYVQNNTRTISDATIALVQEEIEPVRELNIRVAAKRPTVKSVPIQAVVRVNNLANQNSVLLAAEKALLSYIDGLGIGERFSPALAAKAVLALDGVTDISFQQPVSAVAIGTGEICSAGKITLTAE